MVRGSFLAGLGLPRKCFGNAVLSTNVNITKRILCAALLVVTLLPNLQWLESLELLIVSSGEVVTALCQHCSPLAKQKAVSAAVTS